MAYDKGRITMVAKSRRTAPEDLAGKAESSSSAPSDEDAGDQEAALVDALRRALLERGISNPDDDTIRMLRSAALLEPIHQPLISATRLLLGAKEIGDSGSARARSYPAALAAAIAGDSNRRLNYDKVRSLYKSQPVEVALTRLVPQWFGAGVDRLVRSAAKEGSNLPLSDAIVRNLLKSNDKPLRDRFPDLSGLAREVEAQLEPPNSGPATPSTPQGDGDATGRDESPSIVGGPGVWLFYALEGQSAARWADDIAPGHLFFWRHNSVAYTKRMRVGDSVVVMIGSTGKSGRSVGGRIIATGLLAADASTIFMDTRQGARRYPVLCIDAFQKNPIDRREIEEATGARLVIQQGAVHPLTAKALDAINQGLGARSSRVLPIGVDAANNAFSSCEHINAALVRYPHIRMDDKTAQALHWPPRIVTQDEPPQVDEARRENYNAHVPFNTDAPSVTDTLGRGPLALFLARRLHLIWCDLNGCAPAQNLPAQGGIGARLQVKDPGGEDTETFIVHIDSPWGGGKTTFASFVARTLRRRQQKLVQSNRCKTGPGKAVAGRPVASVA
jgi:hypothetical protein